MKVNDAGSGLVHLRNHEQQATLSFVKTDTEVDEETKLPTEDALGELTASLGEGVSLVSMTRSTNRSGWSGYDVIWEFEDINQLTIPDAILGDDEEEDSESSSQEDDQTEIAKSDSEASGFRFSKQGDRLEIHPYGKDAEPQPTAKQIGAVDPFADQPPGSSPTISFGDVAAQSVLAKALTEMRVGIFVQIEGDIAESNAKHLDENLITLINVQIGKLLEQPEAKQHLQKFQGRKPTRAEAQELADELDGLTLDLQNPIVVQFR